MSRVYHNEWCECGQPAKHLTPTGKVCNRCYRIQQMFADSDVCERWHNGICGVRDKAVYDGRTERDWRWGGMD